jgi:hypothetical protein
VTAAAAARSGAPGARTAERRSFGLRIGATNDAYEREADRIADSIVASVDAPPGWSLSTMQLAGRMQRKCACGGAGSCDACAAKTEENEATIQRMPAGPEPETFAPSLVEDVLRSEGAPLDPTARRYFESRFGHDFSRVRVHVGGRAAQSARAVNALAYTVGNHVVFGSGMYAPQTASGRRLLAHELTHTLQQGGARGTREGALRIGKTSDVHERQAEAVGNSIALGHQASGATGPLSVRTLHGAALQRAPGDAAAADEFAAVVARMEEIIRTGGAIPGETRVIGAAIIDVPGYEGPTEMRAISGAATDALSKEGSVYHAGSPAARTLSATRTIAGAGARREFPFSHVNDAEIKLFEDIAARLPANAKGTVHFLTMRVRQVGGKTVFEPIPACSGCTRATFEMGTFKGVKMVSHAATHPTGTLNLAEEPGEGAAKSTDSTTGEPNKTGQGGKAPKANAVQVGTEIKVNSAVRQANGDIVSEVEYNFGKSLDQLNKGAPPGGEVPARITVRITQNSEGAITAVESLSGEPQALVEALARQTIPEGLAGGAEAAAATGARRLALLSKGLKIGGLAAFVVVTGYQLYKATPEQRPRVATQAAGGLAGGALGSYLVCNALLDLETVGWGILICGLIVGGAAGYAGSELAGDAYDEATATDLSRALRRLDARSRNDRILFNLLMGALGPSAAGCIDADFVNRFLSTAPPNLKDYEVVLIASRLKPTAVVLPSMTGRGTVCPNCHAENRPSPAAAGGGQNLYQAMAAACRNALDSALKGLREAVAQLPPAQRPPTVSQLAAPGETHAAPSGAQSPSASKSLQDVCPNCHRAVTADPGRNLAKEFGGFGTGPGGQMTETDLKLLSDWARAQQKPAP